MTLRERWRYSHGRGGGVPHFDGGADQAVLLVKHGSARVPLTGAPLKAHAAPHRVGVGQRELCPAAVDKHTK